MERSFKYITACFILLVFLCKSIAPFVVPGAADLLNISYKDFPYDAESESSGKESEEKSVKKEFVQDQDIFEATFYTDTNSASYLYSYYSAPVIKLFLAVFTPPPEIL